MFLTNVETGYKYFETEFAFGIWYKEIEPPKHPPKEEVIEPIFPEGVESSQPKCTECTPKALYDEFFRQLDLTGLSYTSHYKEYTNSTLIKYNGYNIFEICANSKRFWVKAHPKTLSAALLNCSAYSKTDKLYSKKSGSGVGTTLTSKFVFTDWSQVRMMKPLIQSGFYYRREQQQDFTNIGFVRERVKELDRLTKSKEEN